MKNHQIVREDVSIPRNEPEESEEIEENTNMMDDDDLDNFI
jgi:hypothetical protein